MPNFWTPIVNPVQSGEPVDAPTTNRPIGQLTAREQFLFEQFGLLNQRGGKLVAGNVRLDPAIAPGTFVYFEAASGRYYAAKAEFDADGGPASPRSFVAGLVLSTDGFGGGDVLLQGFVNPNDYGLTVANLLDRAGGSDATRGTLYLSRLVAGKASLAPSAPVVQLGYFAAGGIVFAPLQVGVLHAHRHHGFDLLAAPASSQNYALTGFVSTNGPVDYYHAGASAAPPVLRMGLRVIPGAVPATPQRVEIYRDGAGKLAVHLVSGSGLIKADPTSSGATTVDLPARDWPNYGDYAALAGTGIEIFFYRSDATYASSLAADAATLLNTTAKRFRLFLPDDARGWTNSNPFDPATPANARYRYLLEGDPRLAAAFPPLPVSAADLLQNGTSLVQSRDFALTLEGLWWTATGSAVPGSGFINPWPTDYRPDGTGMAAANARALRLFFARATMPLEDQSVTSLVSGSDALVVTRCPGGEEASRGDLQIALDLSLSENDTIISDTETAFAAVDGVALQRTPVVTELVAGSGILLERISTRSGSRFSGKVRVSRRDVLLEGEVPAAALRNAKLKILNELAVYAEFLAPAQAATAIIAHFKLPQESPVPTHLELRGTFLGDTSIAGGAAAARALLRVTFHVLRAGFDLNSVSPVTAAAIQYWTIPFAPGYGALTLLSQEYPAAASVLPADNVFRLGLGNLNASALIADTGFLPGDNLSVVVARVAANADVSVTDNYAGRLGMTGLRWSVS